MSRMCAHCGNEMRGYASWNRNWLCHPNEGPDCYHLVTVYGHPTPCEDCPGPDLDQALQKFHEFMDREVARWSGANRLMAPND